MVFDEAKLQEIGKSLERILLADSDRLADLIQTAGLKPESDLVGADFSGMDLREEQLANFNLSECNFTECDLREANLANSNLTGATFSSADLRGANLLGATTTDADFSGARISSLQPGRSARSRRAIQPSRSEYRAIAQLIRTLLSILTRGRIKR